jgi:Ca2+-binding EF-hand superfamily protein
MTKYLLLAATAIALASPALAQQGGGRPQMTPEERAAAFVKADANKDGKLDKAELKMTLPEQFRDQVDDERLGQMLARRDTDKDGFVSKAEYDAPMQRPAQ